LRMRTIYLSLLASLLTLTIAAQAQVVNSGVLQPPTTLDRDLYPPTADAKADIRAALSKAEKENKNVIVEFGAIWCLDCHILDNAFKTPGTKELLDANYVVVHVDVGRFDKNLDVAKTYQTPLERGIPALAVLNSKGKVLTSTKSGEFEAARRMTMDDVTKFLNQWKPRVPRPNPRPATEAAPKPSTTSR
jgi:thiol:disulfide interchange protein